MRLEGEGPEGPLTRAERQDQPAQGRSLRIAPGRSGRPCRGPLTSSAMPVSAAHAAADPG